MEELLKLLIPGIGVISGLIATYVTLKNRALLAEVRKELAELEVRMITRLNGTFVRTGECKLREELIQERINAVVSIHKAEPPPDR